MAILLDVKTCKVRPIKTILYSVTYINFYYEIPLALPDLLHNTQIQKLRTKYCASNTIHTRARAHTYTCTHTHTHTHTHTQI